MTIYYTPYTRGDDGEWEVTADSVDSGFETFDALIAVLGEPIHRSQRYVIYGDDYVRSLYTDYCFSK